MVMVFVPTEVDDVATDIAPEVKTSQEPGRHQWLVLEWRLLHHPHTQRRHDCNLSLRKWGTTVVLASGKFRDARFCKIVYV